MLITREGKSNARIILNDKEDKQLLPLAQELQKYIRLVSGATLEIASWQPRLDGNAIHIGPNPRASEIGITWEELEPEGFRISCAGRDLFIIILCRISTYLLECLRERGVQ